jgi:hypothetical protein
MVCCRPDAGVGPGEFADRLVEVISRRQPAGQVFYIYDKQYLTYWLIASAHKLRSLFGGNWSPVAVANAATAAAFWPFEWKFTKTDLTALLAKLSPHQKLAA